MTVHKHGHDRASEETKGLIPFIDERSERRDRACTGMTANQRFA